MSGTGIYEGHIMKKQLKNKLTYYICKTQCTKDIEIHLLIKIGSKAEKSEEAGAAHFLEHMCLGFNKAGLLKNIAFGYTGFEETDFCIYSKSDTKSIHEAMDMLKGILTGEIIDPAQLEDIRKDIAAEWHKQMEGDYFRKRNRVYSKLLPHALFEKMPIGGLNVINKMDMRTLYRFHNNYYVTESAALICSGSFTDIDIERIIKEKFDTAMHRSPCVPFTLSVDAENECKYFVHKEDLQRVTTYEFYTLHKIGFASRIDYFRGFIIEELIYLLMKEFLIDSFSENGIRYIDGRYYNNRITYEYEILTFEVDLNNSTMSCQEVRNLIHDNLKKISKLSDSGDLLKRARQELEKVIHGIKGRQDNFVRECVNNYLFNEPILSWQEEDKLTREIVPQITMEDINKAIMQWQGMTVN